MRNQYTKAFKLETVNFILTQKLSYAKASEQLGIPEQTIGNWIRAYKKSVENPFKNSPQLTHEELELKQFRIKYERIKEENIILKKAVLLMGKY